MFDAIEEGTAERRFIFSAVFRLIRSNSAESHRGSNNISSTISVFCLIGCPQ